MEHSLLSPKNDFVFKHINVFQLLDIHKNMGLADKFVSPIPLILSTISSSILEHGCMLPVSSTQDENKEVMIAFLNALFKSDPVIKDITFKNTDLQKLNEEDKFGILDILATTDAGMVVNVEIQVKNEKNIEDRMLYYGSKLIFEQLSEGEPYSKIKRVITVAILDYNFFPTEKYHSRARLKTDENLHICRNLELHFVELKKLGKHIDESDQFSVWAAFMNNPEDPELLELTDTLPALKKAKADLVRMSNDEELRVLYYARQKVLHDMASMEEQGREQGREEVKFELARKMLPLLDDETIAENFDLPLSIVQALRNE